MDWTNGKIVVYIRLFLKLMEISNIVKLSKQICKMNSTQTGQAD